jgi:quinol monooxygenase YgiN
MGMKTAVGCYSSGDWRVIPGSEDAFITRWTEFLEWTWGRAHGFLSAHLIQNPQDPTHFVSFAEWESMEALIDWRGLADFPVRLDACRALCEDFQGSNYTPVSHVPA